MRDSNQRLKTSWYSKPSASGRILHYKSSHHINQKTNSAMNLIDRIFKLEKIKSRKETCQIIHKRLQQNGYPRTVINNLIKRHHNKMSHQHNSPPPQTSETATKSYRSIPYIKGLSEKVTKFIKSDNSNIEIAYRNNTSNNLFSKLKDKVEPAEKSKIVYSIPCSGTNCKGAYIGQTKTSFHKRMSNHKYDIKRTNQAIVDRRTACLSTKTALMTHMIATKHTFDIDKAKILHQSKSTNKLNLLESLYIQDNPNAVNYKTDTNNINKNYSAILHLIQKRKEKITATTNEPVSNISNNSVGRVNV